MPTDNNAGACAAANAKPHGETRIGSLVLVGKRLAGQLEG